MRRVLSVIPASEVKRRSAEWTVARTETPGWKVLETPNSLVIADAPDGIMRETGVLIEEINVALRAAVSGPTARRMFRVRLFGSHKDFCEFAARCQAANAESFYDPRTGEMALWFEREQKNRAWFQRIAAHETTHAYMDLVWNSTSPLWFAEGMAEYFSTFRWNDGVSLGAVNEEALQIISRDPGSLASLQELVAMGRTEMYSERFPVLYAQAWSLVHYLFAERPQAIRDLLARRTVEDGEALERGWRAHLERLAS